MFSSIWFLLRTLFRVFTFSSWDWIIVLFYVFFFLLLLLGCFCQDVIVLTIRFFPIWAYVSRVYWLGILFLQAIYIIIWFVRCQIYSYLFSGRLTTFSWALNNFRGIRRFSRIGFFFFYFGNRLLRLDKQIALRIFSRIGFFSFYFGNRLLRLDRQIALRIFSRIGFFFFYFGNCLLRLDKQIARRILYLVCRSFYLSR